MLFAWKGSMLGKPYCIEYILAQIIFQAWSMRGRVSATDGNGATVRVVLFDFEKAFELIEQQSKLCFSL